MKLSYRSVIYESEPQTIEFNEGEIGGKYRGRDWKYRYLRHIPHLKPKIYRQYRGVAYSTCPLPLKELAVNPSSQSLASESYCRISPKQQISKNESAHIHWENMRLSLERRLAAAYAKGDTELINLLQKESQEINYSKPLG